MKTSNNPSSAVFQNLAIVFAVLVFASSAPAAIKFWTGPSPGTTATPQSGIWDTNSLNWTTTTGVGVNSFTNADAAIFGGADGAYFIQCVTNLSTTPVHFAASGYVLANGTPTTITVNNTTGCIFVYPGKTATIGTNVVISEPANPSTFNIGATNSGTLIIDNGGTVRQPNNQGFNFDGAPGSTVRVLTGGTLQHAGNGSNIRIGLTANASPTLSIEGGQFICTGGASFGSIILSAANNSTSVVSIASGIISNSFTGNAANGSLNLGNGSTTLSTVNLSGGMLALANIRKTGTNTAISIVNFNGGTLKSVASAAAPTFLPANLTNVTFNVRNTNSTIDNGGFNMGLAYPFVHSTIGGDNAIDGGFTFVGSGVTTVLATNTYTGPTIINGSTVSLGNSGSINSSSSIIIGAGSGGTLTLSNQLVNTTGTFAMTNGTLNLNIVNFPTNVVTGAFATDGGANVINVPVVLGSGTIPHTNSLIKYTSLASGVVDGNNLFTTLSVTLPAGFTGFLTNNTGKKTIDLVLTSGSLAPQIVTQPVSITRYVGGTAQFSVSVLGADGYFWRTNGVFANDSGNISGTKTNVLTITSLGLSTPVNYDVVLTNVSGAVTSSVATLTVINPTNYAGTNLSFSPIAYYRLDEPDNSFPAFDFVGGKDGTYLANVAHVAGPQPGDGYTNFESGNMAIQCANPFVDAHVNISNSWNINTNTVTLVAWVYPIGAQASFAGIVFARNGGGATGGLNYTATTNGFGNHTIGYTWNNDANTFNWDSGLQPPLNQWSLVALVLTPTNATVYVGNTNGLASSIHTLAHTNQSFAGPIAIGSDNFDPGGRSFTGNIDEVAAFDHCLTSTQILALVTAASGLTNFPPNITVQPSSQTVFEHQNVTLSAQVFGTDPLVYQWMRGTGGSYTNVPSGTTPDNSIFTGGTTASLVITNISQNDAADYVLVVTNTVGATTSSVATLMVNPVLGPPTNITTATIQASGANWDTDGIWNIGGSPVSGGATLLSAEYYGSTFVIQTGGGVRTPDFGSPSSPTTSTFPGDVLRVEGNGTYDTSLLAAGAIRIKGGNPSTVNFKKLVMAGGQISSILNSGWPAIIGGGEVNVISNTVVWASDDTSPRSITIQSVLTGNGNVIYHAYNTFTTLQTGSSASLNISNANNTYTGTWDAQLGSLVGSAPGTLGTNTITVEAQGALQTTYDINNTNADLILNGRMNLTQNDTFRSVTVNGTPLTIGVHSAASLTAGLPANFPATWTGVNGALTSTAASGSITVLVGPAGGSDPGIINITNSAGTLQVTWTNSSTILLSATNILGPWVTNTGATSPFTVTNNAPQKFFRLRTP